LASRDALELRAHVVGADAHRAMPRDHGLRPERLAGERGPADQVTVVDHTRIIVARASRLQHAAYTSIRRLSSLSACASIADGEPSIRHAALALFGNAIVSRIESRPAISMTMRS